MIIYLLSLPVWNGLLPAYAFWHFDDFSWGQTRRVAGDKGGDHGDKEGEFDSSHIVMKRWVEFERERRWKSGVQSRDSTVEKSNRYSVGSTSDINHPNGGPESSTSESSPSAPYSARQRHDSNTGPLVLPAPLSTNRMLASAGSGSSVGISRSSEDITYASDMASISNQRWIPSAQDQYSDVYSDSSVPRFPQFDAQVARTAGTNGGVLRNATISSHYPGETQNDFRVLESQAVAYDDQYGSYIGDPEESLPQIPNPRQSRGVSLSDNGPVPGPDGVRRVARPVARRPTSQAPQNRYSRTSTAFNLPPGAAAPQPGGH